MGVCGYGRCCNGREQSQTLWLWVPAFAGTTRGEGVSALAYAAVILRSRALARRLEGSTASACGRSFEARPEEGRAPQDDGAGVFRATPAPTSGFACPACRCAHSATRWRARQRAATI